MQITQFGPRSFEIFLERKDGHTFWEDNLPPSNYPALNPLRFVYHEVFQWFDENNVSFRNFTIFYNEMAVCHAIRLKSVNERYKFLFQYPFIIEFEEDSHAVLFKLRWF